MRLYWVLQFYSRIIREYFGRIKNIFEYTRIFSDFVNNLYKNFKKLIEIN